MWLSGLYGTEKGKIGMKEFRTIFLELYPSLCIYASRFVNDVETSKDIVQEVLLTFWEDNDKLRNKNLIKPYLFKSVKNKALNYKKRESRKSGLDELFDNFNEELANSENESVEAVPWTELWDTIRNPPDHDVQQKMIEVCIILCIEKL